MTVIDRLEIRNWQSIVHADLALGDWTSLVGESDVGKSAVLHALVAALTNQRGDRLVRHGAKMAEVTLHLSDDAQTVITWQKERGKSGRYIVEGRAEHEDADGNWTALGSQRVYEKTAGEVPEEVAALVCVGIEVAGEDFAPGIMGQFDAPFLLSATPRRRAQVLGEFDGTNITMAAEGLLRKAQRGAQDDVKAAEREVERLNGAILPYAALPAAEAALEHAEMLSDALEARSARLGAARLLLATAEATGRAARRAAAEAAAWSQSPGLAAVEAVEARLGRVVAATVLVGRVRAAQAGVARAEAVLAATADLSAPLAALEARHARLTEARRLEGALDRVYLDRLALENTIEDAAAAAHAAQEELAGFVGELCPICNAVITDAVLA